MGLRIRKSRYLEFCRARPNVWCCILLFLCILGGANKWKALRLDLLRGRERIAIASPHARYVCEGMVTENYREIGTRQGHVDPVRWSSYAHNRLLHLGLVYKVGLDLAQTEVSGNGERLRFAPWCTNSTTLTAWVGLISTCENVYNVVKQTSSDHNPVNNAGLMRQDFIKNFPQVFSNKFGCFQGKQHLNVDKSAVPNHMAT